MDEMRMKQRQEPEVFYYDYATPLGMLRIEENGRGLTAVSPVKPECASCHTGAESLSGNGNGADIARCRMDETPLIRRAAAQLQEYFAGKRKVFDLPLAPEGTPFQHRVWAVRFRTDKRSLTAKWLHGPAIRKPRGPWVWPITAIR